MTKESLAGAIAEANSRGSNLTISTVYQYDNQYLQHNEPEKALIDHCHRCVRVKISFVTRSVTMKYITEEPITLAGDARYDSMGHSARMCTYTAIDAVRTMHMNDIHSGRIRRMNAASH